MKRSLYCLALLLNLILVSSTRAQGISISCQNLKLSVVAGESAVFRIDAHGINGFNSSIYLNASTNIKTEFSSAVVNPPYAVVDLKLSPVVADTGMHVILVTASNMGLSEVVRCTLNVSANPQWRRMVPPTRIDHYAQPTIDNNGDFAMFSVLYPGCVLQRFRNMKWDTTRLPGSPVFGHFNHGCFDKKGNVWYGSAQGLSVYDGKYLTTYTTTNSALPSDYIVWCAVDKANTVIACSGSSVMAVDSNRVISTLNATAPNFEYQNTGPQAAIDSNGTVYVVCAYDQKPGLSTARPVGFDSTALSCSAITVDTSGNIWDVISISPGEQMPKLRLRSQGAATRFISLDSRAEGSTIRCIAVDKRGVVWIGASTGLFSYDQGQWQYYNSSNSPLNDDNVYHISVDAHDNLWLHCRDNLYAFNPQGLRAIPLVSTEVNEDLETDLALSSLDLRPNPCSDDVSMSVNAGEEYALYSELGQCVVRGVAKETKLLSLSLATLPRGVYYMRIGSRSSSLLKSE